MKREGEKKIKKKDEKERRRTKKKITGKSRWKFQMIKKIELFVPPKIIARKGEKKISEEENIIRASNRK